MLASLAEREPEEIIILSSEKRVLPNREEPKATNPARRGAAPENGPTCKRNAYRYSLESKEVLGMSNIDIMIIINYLERVVPRGNEETDELYKLISMLRKLV